jgi:hypothetical protein
MPAKAGTICPVSRRFKMDAGFRRYDGGKKLRSVTDRARNKPKLRMVDQTSNVGCHQNKKSEKEHDRD